MTFKQYFFNITELKLMGCYLRIKSILKVYVIIEDYFYY